MAIAVYFHPESLTAAQYDDVFKRLEDAGAGSPAGRIHHSCFGRDGDLMVYEVWESQEAFDAFGQTLMPIAQEGGVDPGQPDAMPVHNIVQ
jgi:hypothetical protein